MLSKDRFSRLPRHWLRKQGPSPWLLAKSVLSRTPVFYALPGEVPTPGAVTAALKIYITLVAMADDDLQRNRAGRYCVKTTYDEIQQYLSLSRACVRKGLLLLEKARAIERLAHKPLLYQIVGLDPDKPEGKPGFVKLPKGHLYGGRRNNSQHPITLAQYPSRGIDPMNGLSLYLLLLSVVQRDNNLALITYDRIRDRTGMSSRQIRAAIDHLVNHNLISVLRITNEETFEAFGLKLPEGVLQGTPNAYLIKGITGRKYNERVNTMTETLELAQKAALQS